MKSKSNQSIKCDKGITLVALIITIILLVILAAITIRSIWEFNIVRIASDGVIDYTLEQQKETNTLDDIAKIIGQITGDDLTLLKPTVTLKGTKGTGNVYSSDVVVGIKDSLEVATLGKIEIHYIIEGLNEGREETVQGRETSVTVTEQGKYKVIAWMQDSKGNKSDNEEIEFIIDKSKPSDPRISLTGTEGDNEYYIDNKVGVTIEAGENIVSGVLAIKYRVEGANAVAETTVYADTAEFDIETDGGSTIYATIISNTGEESEEIYREMKKDSQRPNVATLTYNTCDTVSIKVTATGQDATSKVASYIFEKSTDNENFSPVEEVSGRDGTIQYTYKTLNDGAKYYLRVTVKDNAGLTQPSNVVEQTTVKANQAPSFAATPTVAKVEESNTSLTITAKATDPDGDSLTYTLCDSDGNAITTNVSQTTNASGEVVFTHSELGNFSTHTYIVKVTDGKVSQAVPSNQCTGTTYCKAAFCNDYSASGKNTTKDCPYCDGGTVSAHTPMVCSIAYQDESTTYQSCTVKGCDNFGTGKRIFRCGSCGQESTVFVCSWHEYPESGTKYNGYHSSTGRCYTCNGTGNIQERIYPPCDNHSLYKQHFFCNYHNLTDCPEYH